MKLKSLKVQISFESSNSLHKKKNFHFCRVALHIKFGFFYPLKYKSNGNIDARNFVPAESPLPRLQCMDLKEILGKYVEFRGLYSIMNDRGLQISGVIKRKVCRRAHKPPPPALILDSRKICFK